MLKTWAGDLGGPIGATTVMNPASSDVVAMRAGRGRGGKHLFCSNDEDSGDYDDDEPPREKESVDVLVASRAPNFRD